MIMLIYTHLAITLFFVLLLMPFVEYKIVFLISALISSIIPDIDSKFSTLGRKKILRILQFFVKHRGILHSFSFLFLISLLLILFYPKIAFGFVLGYGLHLFADSFTKNGIKPFYPFKRKIRGIIKTGGKLETMIFVVFLIADLFLIIRFFVDIF